VDVLRERLEPRTRCYSLGMPGKARADDSDAISRLADSGGKAILNLVVLPLRIFIGALDIFETQVHKAADALRATDPLDERVVELETRMASLEQKSAGRRQSSRTPTAARKRTPTDTSVEPQQVEHSAGQHKSAPGSETSAGQGDA
jgi:hypothetical protein